MYMDVIEMVFPVWVTDVSIKEQGEKVAEEAEEVLDVVSDLPSLDAAHCDRVVEECLDTIQASLNLIYKVYPECHLQEAIMRNFMKNKRRGYIPQS